MTTPQVACFRPDDERLARAISVLEALGVTPRPDPMLAIEPTGERPRADAAYLVLTSRTGADLVVPTDVRSMDATVCAIGPTTAAALEERGISVDVTPEEYTSDGLVDRLREDVDGARVEIARSDHGSGTLPAGLCAAGAYVHETILYTLDRPAESGLSTERLVEGELDALLFTSSLTVEHVLAAASERGIRDEVLAATANVIVGAIGPPTQRTAIDAGIPVDVVASEATFEALARETVAALEGTRGP